MQVGWICVKQGLAKPAPRLWARQARGDVAALGVGGEVEDVAVAAGGQHHRVGRRGTRSCPVTRSRDDDAAGLAVDHDQVQHLGARVTSSTVPRADLPLQRLVGAEQQLLAGLAAGVEGPRHLRATEGAVGQQAAVLARERHALRHALVDDVDAHLGQPVDVGLARAEVAALDRVVEQPADRVAVVLVVLGGVDAALRRDASGPGAGCPGSRST